MTPNFIAAACGWRSPHSRVAWLCKRISLLMEVHSHIKTAGGAIKQWFIATTQDALAVGAIWLVGLLIIGVPWAPFWAFLGAAFQFIPGIGAILALIGPARSEEHTSEL